MASLFKSNAKVALLILSAVNHMVTSYPKTIEEAVPYGLLLLDDSARVELSRTGYVDPHTKYGADFISIIGVGLGISDGSNRELLVDVLAKHSDELHFLEIEEGHATQDGALRLVLSAMARTLMPADK